MKVKKMVSGIMTLKKYASKENPLKDEDEYGMKDEMLDSLKDLGL